MAHTLIYLFNTFLGYQEGRGAAPGAEPAVGDGGRRRQGVLGREAERLHDGARCDAADGDVLHLQPPIQHAHLCAGAVPSRPSWSDVLYSLAVTINKSIN